MSEQKEHAKFLSTITGSLLQDSHVHFNVGQNLIVTTEDKLKGVLREYADCLAVQDRWQTPASIFITLLLVFCTASFHDALNFSKATWEAVFLICTAASLLWLVRSVYRAIRAKRTIENLIDDIKRTGISSQSNESAT